MQNAVALNFRHNYSVHPKLEAGARLAPEILNRMRAKKERQAASVVRSICGCPGERLDNLTLTFPGGYPPYTGTVVRFFASHVRKNGIKL
jgi:hypothetical protein